MCHGVFDVVHPGHMRHLLYAKEQGRYPGRQPDRRRAHHQGQYRPFVPQELRALNLAALEMVDYRRDRPQADADREHRAHPARLLRQGLRVHRRRRQSAKTQEEIEVLQAYGGEILFTPGDIVYSSSHLIELAPPKIALEKLLTLDGGGGTRLSIGCAKRSTTCEGKRVHVVGDTIVDSYTQTAMIGGHDQDADA